MLNKKEYLKGMTELDTGKAQPLFHPFPVINIFREDEALKEEYKKEKTEEEKLLLGTKGILCDGAFHVVPQIRINMELDGAKFMGEEDIFTENPMNPDFIVAMDGDASFLKYSIAAGGPALKATYGLVSRYGMRTDTPSLAQPAVGAKNVTMVAKALQAAAGVDKKDPMSRDAYIYEYMEALKEQDLSGMKIAIPANVEAWGLDEVQLGCFNQMLDVFEAKGADIDTVELEWMEYALAVHEMIASAETVMTAAQTEVHFEEKEEIRELGEWLLEEEHYKDYYLKALKLRSLIKDSYDMLFREYALFVVPYMEEADAYSVAANLAGLPSMILPVEPYEAKDEEDEILVEGLFMVAGANYENNLLKAAYIYEQEVL